MLGLDTGTSPKWSFRPQPAGVRGQCCRLGLLGGVVCPEVRGGALLLSPVGVIGQCRIVDTFFCTLVKQSGKVKWVILANLPSLYVTGRKKAMGQKAHCVVDHQIFRMAGINLWHSLQYSRQEDPRFQRLNADVVDP